MLTDYKVMDIARKVLQTYFKDNSFPLVQHHVDSYNDFINKSIPAFIKASNPVELELVETNEKRRYIRIYVGGKDASKIKFLSPVEEDGTATLPHACRLDNRTYTLTIRADLEIDFVFVDGTKEEVETKTFEDVELGKIPLMLRSDRCYLTAVDSYEAGECKFEPGGYFIIDGSEKVLMTQEKLGINLFYVGKRTRKGALARTKGLTEQAEPLEIAAKYKTTDEYYVGINSLSEDGSRGPYSHFLTIPSENRGDYNREKPDGTKEFVVEGNCGLNERLAMIQLSGFKNPVPLLSVFAALGVTSDRDLYDITLVGVPDKDRIAYDDLFAQLILSHENLIMLDTPDDKDPNMTVLKTQAGSKPAVVRALHDSLFSHLEKEEDEDVGSLFRRKAYMLGHMLRMAMDVIIGRKNPSDRDSIPFKRFVTSGVLCFDEFRRIYRDMTHSTRLDLDSRIQYEKKTFEGKNLINLIEVENIGYFWKKHRMLNEFSKSFKGMWNGVAGISQELQRPSYLAVIHHLRKTDLQIAASMNTAPPRRLYASQYGILCPVDSPDGSDIGYKKALTVLARVSSAFPSNEIKKILRNTKLILETRDIHPAIFEPFWTKVFLNSDLFGICRDTEDLHNILINIRRNREIPMDVSLSWNRTNNEYIINCDAGRPVRPVYRPGTTLQDIENAKNWNEMLNHIDYIDALETDTLLISLEPFHPELPSDIHMTMNMSAVANMVPYANNNPCTRSVFSIAQQKQAASWFHTNYLKRFDTISMFLNEPQKPLSQTWIYREMMGAGGCMPYGVNCVVAFTVYGGQNQEDSVIINGGSLKRGMFRICYFHSYDNVEQMLDAATGTKTEVFNVLKDETIKRKENMNYEKLDAEGIIKVGEMVDDNTILVGIRSPVMDAQGRRKAWRDVSIEPKRGQVGRVDAVYKYSTKDGLKGVKIRIIEEREPIVGDKFASRHSQKGTCGLIIDEEDMPFTSRGVRPDLIFNPHGIPTRMTIGQFLEAISNKVGCEIGSFIDATPFTVSKRLEDVKELAYKLGLHPNGHEILYNGMTGEQMEVEIFTGVIYYQRLKQMVEDKINYRTTGPKTQLTHQPVQGRSNDGGMRIGEMERDSIISHGMSKFLNESLMDRSDAADVQFNKETGMLDTSKDTLHMPYAASLYMRELESLHINVKFETQ